MTLALTEVSQFGIAMAADSALTWSGERSFTGAQKLIPAMQIKAGFTIWGNFLVGNQYADEWLQGFISGVSGSSASLWNVANYLAEELNRSFGGPIGNRMGIHVAGYDTMDGVRGPAAYHVHNGHAHVECQGGEVRWVAREDPPIREFRAERDCPPVAGGESGSAHLIRNGDIAVYAFLWEALRSALGHIHELTSLEFPFPPSLSTRGEYLRFCIQTVADLHRLSNFRRRVLTQAPTVGETHIGGPITVLTISERGIQDFYTK